MCIRDRATAVTADGRITPGDLGIWDDAHAEPLARVARFLQREGAVAGIQLAHAGRKASCDLPWKGGAPLSPQQGRWPVVGPSAVPFTRRNPQPTAARPVPTTTGRCPRSTSSARSRSAG